MNDIQHSCIIKKLNEPRMLEIYLNEATRSKNTKPQHQRYEAALCKER